MENWFESLLQSIESKSQFQILAKLVAPIKPSLKAAVLHTKKLSKNLEMKKFKFLIIRRSHSKDRYTSLKKKFKMSDETLIEGVRD